MQLVFVTLHFCRASDGAQGREAGELSRYFAKQIFTQILSMQTQSVEKSAILVENVQVSQKSERVGGNTSNSHTHQDTNLENTRQLLAFRS